MHVLKWIEACLVLFVWGAAVKSISGKRASVPIFIAVSLSFHYLYDTFFFCLRTNSWGYFFVALHFIAF